MALLGNGDIPTPLEGQDYYQSKGLHQDGQTPLYQLKNEYLHS